MSVVAGKNTCQKYDEKLSEICSINFSLWLVLSRKKYKFPSEKKDRFSNGLDE